ncbi:hypothetical protein EJ05DRAFT_499113 [Pseudovirgaria hyperparasitica]|uniref:MOSC domain-containing protein n=1 Tax=Pseudovirgaria hyperparasitica TaxID=470096 RepID=A0A6A6WFM0_9PEZI|nr:uncharacterized protein EJ05DRAFT_499113 [Pseudovirgaria hyperparasitica]KAF2759921.1 hypothetical protein EJ05DRAFT_499113 [Pseudovirgaria hyperparasitica]
MKVKQILAYPIKSLRGVSLPDAVVTKYGLSWDRRFMLVKIDENAPTPADWKVQNMAVSIFSAMCLFTVELKVPNNEDEQSAYIIVTFDAARSEKPRTLKIPMFPNTADLDTKPVNLHGAKTTGFVMGQKYRDWFSDCFGFDTALIYVGDNSRHALCSNPARNSSTWLSSFTRNLPAFIVGEDQIRFQDCVPYLVVSDTSCNEMSDRLPEGVEMDITKLRPNIVIEGAEEPWEEDYWAELAVGNVKIITAHNCGRCQSINVNYEDGRFRTGPAGAALKTLMRDRRIDKGHGYAPVFGRYSYLDNRDDGKMIRVGDDVKVLKTNITNTTFDFTGSFA